jgi:hypothetical protein
VTVDDGTATRSQTFDWLLVPIILAHPGDQASVGDRAILRFILAVSARQRKAGNV